MKLHTTRRPRYRTRDNLPCLSAWMDWPLECGECVGSRGLLARWTLAGPLLLMREYCGVEHASTVVLSMRVLSSTKTNQNRTKSHNIPPPPLDLMLEYALSLARDLAHSWPRGPHQYYLCATPPSFYLEKPPENQMDGSYPTGLMHSYLPHPSRGSQMVVPGFSLGLKSRSGPLNRCSIVPFPVLVMDVVRGLGSV
jgi:hypothetical protein